MTAILRLQNLSVCLKGTQTSKTLLSSITLDIQRHRTLGVVGESGSGKTLLSHAILGLLDSQLQVSGEIWFNDQNLLASEQVDPWADLRGKVMSLIVQNPMSAFDPRQTLRTQFMQTLQLHFPLSRTQCEDLAHDVLLKCQLGSDAITLLNRYPHQLSGGQLQRIMIALALAHQPQILIADEPTTALDSVSQYEIVQLLKILAHEHGLTLIFVSHDLNLLKQIADDVVVLRHGQLVESATLESVWNTPKDPYTQYLLNACQKLDARFQVLMRGGHAS
ncbi:ABC transporter ATP-binding protein [Orrella sp. 11846]|uniref:ABC transporter ATP-binding protein n=1 Tax=Orrella sp. 11846 TaxID=3409913 RepID=UPI003B5CE4D5